MYKPRYLAKTAKNRKEYQTKKRLITSISAEEVIVGKLRPNKDYCKISAGIMYCSGLPSIVQCLDLIK